MAHALAVDIGGTKMAAGVVDDEGNLGERRQIPTPSGAGAEALFAALTGLVRPLLGPGVEICGVGCGGPMSRTDGTVSPVNIAGWRGFPLHDRLASEVGLPVVIDNDAKALALAEGWKGAAAGCADYLGMVVSTGVGGGIVLDGRLLEGGEGNAGHIGHVIVEPGGRPCGCGARGCLEAEASGTAIAAVTGRPPAEAPQALRVRVGRLVGRAVASVANLLDLSLAVVAGSVALGYGSVFFEAAQGELRARSRLEFSRHAAIRPAALGSDAPLIGAAALAWQRRGHAVLGGRDAT